MVGAVLIILVLLAVIPVFLVSGGVLMAVTGWLFKEHAEKTHEGSELLDTNI